MPKIDIKGGNIEDFRRKPSAYRAHRLFIDCGTDLPDDIIGFLRNESKKWCENYEINNDIPRWGQENSTIAEAKIQKYDALESCHTAIVHWGWPPMVAYDTHADELGISTEAMKKKYNRAFRKKK